MRATGPWRWMIAGIGSAAVMFLIARGSTVAIPYHAAESGLLRLSWSARPERIEICRTLSKEELAQREEHMRQRVECDGRSATYALLIEVDGQQIGKSVVRGAGMRHDRPIYLLRDFAVPSGTHRIRVSFSRREKTDNDAAAFRPAASGDADTGIYMGRAQREAAEHARRAEAAIPPTLALDTSLTFAPRHVVIITFNQDQRRLQLVDEAAVLTP